MTKTLGVLALIVSLPAAVLLARQQPPPSTPTFRAGVNLVTVDVIVRDGKTGKLVTGLTKDDFQIEDEGKPQTIASFAFVDLPKAPVAAVDTRPGTPAVQSDQQATNPLGTGRLFLVVVDDIDLPFLETGPLRDLLHRFVDHHLQEGDQAAIVPVSDVEVAQGFTGDRARLDQVIDRLQGGILDARPGQGSYDALGAIQGIAAAMTHIPARRKALIFIGDHMWESVLGSPAFNDTVKIAAAGNVAIYPVDPLGLSATNFGEALRALATETGGVASVTSNDFDGALTRIVREAGTYYLLGFSPTERDDKPGDLRRLKVTVRRPGLVVQARKAYVQLPPEDLFSPSTAPLRKVATSALPIDGIPLHIHAACFANDGRTDSVVVSVSVGGSMASLAGHKLEYAIVGADDHGRVTDAEEGTTKIPRVDLQPDTRVVSVLELKPGLASVRAAVRSDDGQVGSVFLNLNVPTLEQGRLALSDVELTSLSTRVLVVGKPPAFLKQTMPDSAGGPPDVRRHGNARHLRRAVRRQSGRRDAAGDHPRRLRRRAAPDGCGAAARETAVTSRSRPVRLRPAVRAERAAGGGVHVDDRSIGRRPGSRDQGGVIHDRRALASQSGGRQCVGPRACGSARSSSDRWRCWPVARAFQPASSRFLPRRRSAPASTSSPSTSSSATRGPASS